MAVAWYDVPVADAESDLHDVMTRRRMGIHLQRVHLLAADKDSLTGAPRRLVVLGASVDGTEAAYVRKREEFDASLDALARDDDGPGGSRAKGRGLRIQVDAEIPFGTHALGGEPMSPAEYSSAPIGYRQPRRVRDSDTASRCSATCDYCAVFDAPSEEGVAHEDPAALYRASLFDTVSFTGPIADLIPPGALAKHIDPHWFAARAVQFDARGDADNIHSCLIWQVLRRLPIYAAAAGTGATTEVRLLVNSTRLEQSLSTAHYLPFKPRFITMPTPARRHSRRS